VKYSFNQEQQNKRYSKVANTKRSEHMAKKKKIHRHTLPNNIMQSHISAIHGLL